MRAAESKFDFSEPIRRAIAENAAKIRFGYPWWLRLMLARDVIGIALGRRIYLRGDAPAASIERLLRHELVHVRQANRLGLPLFMVRYVLEFLRHWRRLRSIPRAYSSISFEIEARAAETEGE